MTLTPTVGNSLTSLRSWALSHTLSNSQTPTVGNDLNRSITLAPQAALSLSLSNSLTPTVGNSLSNHMIKSRSSCVYSGKY